MASPTGSRSFITRRVSSMLNTRSLQKSVDDNDANIPHLSHEQFAENDTKVVEKDELIEQECKILLDIDDAAISCTSDGEACAAQYSLRDGPNNGSNGQRRFSSTMDRLGHDQTTSFDRRLIGEEHNGKMPSSFRLALKQVLEYSCASKDIADSLQYTTGWQQLRWKARTMTQVIVGGMTCVYCLITAVSDC